jgi:hypothetical protein
MKLLLLLIPLSLTGCMTQVQHKYILELTRKCTSIEITKEMTKLKCKVSKNWDL